MPQHIVKIKSIEKITHDVLQIITSKPARYDFVPGQATEISINQYGWKEVKRPFTFTCLSDKKYLEFTIKTYPDRKSVTNELLQLKKNDELIVQDVFGAIAYKGEGVFIAGGAGVTPFICIFRHLRSINAIGGNKLICANKTKSDIILENEFEGLLGHNFINILSEEEVPGYEHGIITGDFIKAHSGGMNKIFYLCGPPAMMDAVEHQLAQLKVPTSSIIKESF
jgi:ferredoxin-NADP reductase